MTFNAQMIEAFEGRFNGGPVEPFEADELSAIMVYNAKTQDLEDLLDTENFLIRDEDGCRYEDRVGQVLAHFAWHRQWFDALDILVTGLALGAEHVHGPAAMRLLSHEFSRYYAHVNYVRRIALQGLIGDAGPVPEVDDQGRVTFPDINLRIPLRGTAVDAG